MNLFVGALAFASDNAAEGRARFGVLMGWADPLLLGAVVLPLRPSGEA